ncbi:MAG: transcription antitermination factor NusB [Halobacteriovoraceae bacterium]|nr:transcription antitermination factor NusB [Halobacteriovoraceae bacterium]|tara:strand:- start:1947 stop:2384 length:438 start_codon:yes stop_codon:yes gene_type:complete
MNNSLIREFSFLYLFHLQLPIFESVRNELSTSQDDLRDSMQEFRGTTDINLSAEEFKESILRIQKVSENIKTLEESITPFLKNWTLERISKVDRTLLILSTSELKNFDTPPKVVINEGIELAKKYGSEESPKFVNAILDKIAKSN